MPKPSAGILMYRFVHGQLQVLLVHPGGPFWRSRDLGSWSIPKGEYEPPEDPLTAAIREFEEETGTAPSGEFVALTPLRQPSTKTISAWALQGDLDPSSLRSNTFTAEWPPRSGKTQEFPEVDRAEWFDIGDAENRILKGQLPFLHELVRILGPDASASPFPKP